MKYLLIVLFSLTSCSNMSVNTSYLKLPVSSFKNYASKEILYFAGKAKAINLKSNVIDTVLHKESWNVYEIEGYFLPNGKELTSVRVAHKSNGELIVDYSWFAILREVSGDLKRSLNVDYLLDGVILGESIFCPENEEKNLFENQEAVFVRIGDNITCYRI